MPDHPQRVRLAALLPLTEVCVVLSGRCVFISVPSTSLITDHGR